MTQIELIEADITTVEVDAIVNAASPMLLGGVGVDGAIHRAAGPELLKECRVVGGCPTGDARITEGYNLPAAHVIHTVGPIWQGGTADEDELLASCYKRCFMLALYDRVTSLAFPAISTGVYGFPKKRAAAIAVDETRLAIKQNKKLKKVMFVSVDDETTSAYRDLLGSDSITVDLV